MGLLSLPCSPLLLSCGAQNKLGWIAYLKASIHAKDKG